ncbi:MAG: glycosyltransferase family 2 protein [Burkholderiales bacterium]|nr:glycosyltransferase family 2 protein [Burkholderiales bacterium]
MTSMNVLILGAGPSLPPHGEEVYPTFMEEVGEAPLIQRLVQSCAPLDPQWIGIACQASDIARYRLGDLPRILHPAAMYVLAKGPTAGAACTAMLAAEHIDNHSELLILGSTEYVDVSFAEVLAGFRQRGLDAGVLTFNSIHPRYSYVRVDEFGMVTEASEKKPVSNTAVASFFWFRRGSDFVRAAQDVIRKDDHVNGSFYITPTLNQLLLRQLKVGAKQIPNATYHPLKTARQIESFETAQEVRR